MTNTLVSPSDLAAFPGAPFDEALVDIAAATARSDVDWHIAPTRTETVTLDGPGGTVLLLPSRHVVTITAVRDVSSDKPVPLTGWRVSRRAGLLYRPGCWPTGPEVIEVDLDHGYTTTPLELLPVLAELCQAARVNSAVRQESAGGESIAYSARGAITPESARVLDRFTAGTGF